MTFMRKANLHRGALVITSIVSSILTGEDFLRKLDWVGIGRLERKAMSTSRVQVECRRSYLDLCVNND